ILSMPLTRAARSACAVVMMVMLLAGCEQASVPATPVLHEAVPPKEVSVFRVQRQPWPRTIHVQGSLLAYEDAVIGSKLAGRVAEVAVDLGSVVRRGDVLVRLVRSE